MSAGLESLGEIRRFVRQTAEGFQAGPDEVEDLILAVDEAVTNVIQHGYRSQPGWIEIEIHLEADTLHVHLRDHAPPFDPTGLSNPEMPRSLAEGASGGLGVYLMRQCVEGVSHRKPPQGGNELTMMKRINRSGSTEDTK